MDSWSDHYGTRSRGKFERERVNFRAHNDRIWVAHYQQLRLSIEKLFVEHFVGQDDLSRSRTEVDHKQRGRHR